MPGVELRGLGGSKRGRKSECAVGDVNGAGGGVRARLGAHAREDHEWCPFIDTRPLLRSSQGG
jgi:hypothetical protein